MRYYSTNSPKSFVSLKEAVLKGLADDNGLYMPETIPTLPKSFFDNMHNMSLPEIGYEVLKPYFCPDIPETVFKEIVTDALNFEIPLIKVDDDIYTAELFHGPTCAFKDVGGRFMARILGYFVKDEKKEINILVATSGDTGSAVANGFYKVDGIKVFVLYPKGLVSDIQEKQFTTLGHNITSIEVAGTFDDCQRIVKEAFLDKKLNIDFTLTSANSINLARFIPQSIYYYYAVSRLPQSEKGKKIMFCVPSGNFGNLTAGIFAKKMGLAIDHYLAATNINDVVPEYVREGKFTPRASLATIANAMDVGNPSNFARMVDIYSNSHKAFTADIKADYVTDDEIRKTIITVDKNLNYTLDPHGAVGYCALKKALTKDFVGIFLETAHPAKFPEVVEPLIGREVESPQRLLDFKKGIKKSIEIDKTLDDLKNILYKQ